MSTGVNLYLVTPQQGYSLKRMELSLPLECMCLKVCDPIDSPRDRALHLRTGRLGLGSLEPRACISQHIKINTRDGLKLIFEDKSWILLRASGTEPKFRYYYELASTSPTTDGTTQHEEYKAAAVGILESAQGMCVV